jgi:hypothetical protein
LDVFRHEWDWLDDRPTKAECDRDEAELRSWPRAQYNNGGA